MEGRQPLQMKSYRLADLRSAIDSVLLMCAAPRRAGSLRLRRKQSDSSRRKRSPKGGLFRRPVGPRSRPHRAWGAAAGGDSFCGEALAGAVGKAPCRPSFRERRRALSPSVRPPSAFPARRRDGAPRIPEASARAFPAGVRKGPEGRWFQPG